MTPRMSVRARAREVYGDLAERLAPRESAASETVDPSSPRESAAAPTPDPSPLLAKASGGGEKNDLTTRVRDLYENSAVPVREIARIAGVTERTIYKYVIRQNWKRRYVCAARDEAVASANRGRRWRVSPEREVLEGRADVAPAKGAGGRFIRREDIGKPFATGLKATDAAGRERALDAYASAARLGRLAQARAEAEARHATHLRAIAATTQAVADLNAFRRRFAGVLDKAKRDARRAALAAAVNAEPSKELPKPVKPNWPPLTLVVVLEGLHIAAVQASLRVWQAVLPRER